MKLSNSIITRWLPVILCTVLLLMSTMSVWANSDTILFTPAFPKVARVSDTSLKLTWGKVSKASGYEIYRYDAKSKKTRKVATVKSGKTVGWTDSKLKTGRKYSYQLRAYAVSAQGKVYSPLSYQISAIPYKKTAKTVNAGSKIKGADNMDIGLKQVLNVKKPVNAKVSPAKYGTAKKKKVTDSRLRLIVNGNPMFKLSGKDSIVGSNVGTANAYLVAHNGNVKKIKVRTVDYSRPKEWVNLREAKQAVEVLVYQRDDLIDVFSYYAHSNNGKSGYLKVDDQGQLINESNLPIGNMEDAIIRLLTKNPFLDSKIWVSSLGCTFRSFGYTGGIPYHCAITFSIQDDRAADGEIIVAKHWFVESYNTGL